jgi:hypothetical protein
MLGVTVGGGLVPCAAAKPPARIVNVNAHTLRSIPSLAIMLFAPYVTDSWWRFATRRF